MTGLNPNAEAISDLAELMLRQVHPNRVTYGNVDAAVFVARLESGAFEPRKNENFGISVSRSSMTTAAKAHEGYVARGRESAGVWAVSVEEVQTTGLCAKPDPLDDDPAHACVDFSPVLPKAATSKGQINRAITIAAVALRDAAVARGRLFPT